MPCGASCLTDGESWLLLRLAKLSGLSTEEGVVHGESRGRRDSNLLRPLENRLCQILALVMF